MSNHSIYNAIKKTIGEVSMHNNFKFTNEDISNIVNQMWNDHPYIDDCVDYSIRYFETMVGLR